MIHSFRKHGTSPTAPARAPLTPRCIRMVLGPPANAPPPYARLILWLLLAVPPTPPGSQAETPARFGKEPVGPTRSAAGRRRGETWGTLGAVSEDAERQEKRRAHGGGGGCGEEARGRGAGTEPPPRPTITKLGAPWAAWLPVHERRVSAHPPLPPGPCGSESLVRPPRGFLPRRAGISAPDREPSGCREPRPPLAPPSRPLPATAALAGVEEPEEARHGEEEGKGGAPGGGGGAEGEERRGPAASGTASPLLARAPLSCVVPPPQCPPTRARKSSLPCVPHPGTQPAFPPPP